MNSQVRKMNIIETLQQTDYDAYARNEERFPLLRDAPDAERLDYFDVPYGPDSKHRLDIHRLQSEELRPVILFIHGGGWAKRDKDLSRFVVPAWMALGYTVASINYRLTDPNNSEPGLRNPHPAQIDDCSRALKWIIDNIEHYGGNPHRIAVAGHSAGGHLAALLVSDTRWHDTYQLDIGRIRCWISLSGIHDLTLEENYTHPMMQEYLRAFLDADGKAEEASPIRYFRENFPPGFLAHGLADYMVPLSNSQNLHQLLVDKGIDAELYGIPGAMHMNYFSEISVPGHFLENPMAQFLARHLDHTKQGD